ncbi:MAG: hypothetical protein WCT04_21075 [Planctomycetota bacterium]
MHSSSSTYSSDTSLAFVRFAVRALVFCALVTVPAFTATLPPPALVNGGAKIFISKGNPQQNKIVVVGFLQAPPNINLNNMMVGIDLGGVQRNYTLSPDGEGVATPDLFQVREAQNGYIFILSTLDNSLGMKYLQYGIMNQTASSVPLSIPLVVNFNSVMYSSTLSGTYDGILDVGVRGFIGVIKRPKDPFKTITHITTLAASPNPTTANTPVTIKGAVSLANFTGNVAGNVYFGDRTPPIHTDGATLQAMLKTGITHTYLNDGVYVARISLVGGDEIADTRLFVIVGDGFVINSENGAVARLVKTPGGGVSLQVGVGNVPGAQTAQTKFLDMKGNAAGIPPAPPPPGGQMGLAPSNTFTTPGIYVAKAEALDSAGGSLGTFRRTIVISAADIGTSSVQNSNEIAPRDSTTDSTITLTSMSGKFFFTSTSADKVIFNGSITLPVGFDPKSATGNDITIAMGNVLDTIHLNEKNKLTLPTTEGYITRFRMTVPKLPSGVATGTETAKVSMTMNVADLDLLGFNSEGISVSLRSDEVGQTSVARFIQIDMLVGGKSYSSLIQVSYATNSSSELGSISGRSSK